MALELSWADDYLLCLSKACFLVNKEYKPTLYFLKSAAWSEYVSSSPAFVTAPHEVSPPWQSSVTDLPSFLGSSRCVSLQLSRRAHLLPPNFWTGNQNLTEVVGQALPSVGPWEDDRVRDDTMIHMEVLAWSWAFMAQGVKTTYLRFTAYAGIGIAVMRLEYGDGENTARSCWSVFSYSWLFRSGKNTLKCLGSQTCNY